MTFITAWGRDRLQKFMVEYEKALADGATPLGEPICVGRVSASKVAADALGLTRNQQTWAVKLARQEGLLPPSGMVVVGESVTVGKDGDELRRTIISKPAPGDVYEPPPGFIVKGESVLVDAEGREKARWIKTREGAGAGLVDGLREAFEAYRGGAGVIEPPPHEPDDLLTVYPIPDLHLGMYAWGRETGADYDVDIAVRNAMRGVNALVAQSRPSRRAVLLGLGDYFHANDAKAATPGSGHQLDVDARWPKVFKAGAMLAVAMVEALARKHPQVEVVFLPGNHDPDAAMSLTVALSLFFDRTTHVKVYDEPGVFWHKRHGQCLLGATHGHTMRPDRMAMILATDRAEDWGQTQHRHVFFGHIHHETAKECAGVRVESFNSPAARDAWNAASGYRSGRALNAITFHADHGEIGRHRVAITHKGVA